MEWLFFQSQSHRPAHVRREVFLAHSRHLNFVAVKLFNFVIDVNVVIYYHYVHYQSGGLYKERNSALGE